MESACRVVLGVVSSKATLVVSAGAALAAVSSVAVEAGLIDPLWTLLTSFALSTTGSFVLGFACCLALAKVFWPQPESKWPDLGSRKQNAFRAKTFPPAYPNGWYKLMNSFDLKPGQKEYLQCLGQHLVVFRGENGGKASVLDAYCPHLGANLGVGGKVVGDCIQCPFHEWSFKGDGQVAKIPYYEGEVPKTGHAKAWHVDERYKMIMIWFDAEGRPPAYEIPGVPSIDDGSMVFRGSTDLGRDVRMHIQDFAENSVDFAHFPVLHQDMMIPWTPYKIPLIKVHHEAGWEMDKEKPHLSYFTNNAHLQIFGKDIPRTAAKALITFMGPCGIVSFRFEIEGLGNIHMIQCHLPREQMAVKTDFLWWADKSIPRFLVSYVVGNWYSQWHNDLEVWENKIFHRTPVILKTDGPVGKLRRWYSQFYSPSSEKVAAGVSSECKAKELDW